MARRRAAALVVAAAALAACPSRVFAADAPASAEHDAVFRNGLDQYAHGNHIAAIATWESLLATLGEERGYKVLYNLGLAYQSIGDATHAIERYASFVKQVGARPDVPRELADRAADAKERLEQLKKTHGAVNVHAPTRGGLVLTRIGTSEPRAAGYVVWLAPGHHDLELFVGTDHVKKTRLEVVQGQTLDVDTSPPEPPPSAPAPPPVLAEHAAPPERSSTWIWVGAGATVVSLALPIALFAAASRAKSDAEALGRGNTGYADARSHYDGLRTAHYVSYALPVALGLATVGYVVLRPSAKSSSAVGVAVGPAGATFAASF